MIGFPLLPTPSLRVSRVLAAALVVACVAAVVVLVWPHAAPRPVPAVAVADSLHATRADFDSARAAEGRTAYTAAKIAATTHRAARAAEARADSAAAARAAVPPAVQGDSAAEIQALQTQNMLAAVEITDLRDALTLEHQTVDSLTAVAVSWQRQYLAVDARRRVAEQASDELRRALVTAAPACRWCPSRRAAFAGGVLAGVGGAAYLVHALGAR